MNTPVFINVTEIEPRLKHPVIFDTFDSIAPGHMLVIHNDHDPKPLYYQLLGERGNCFSWTYLSNGPEIWEVEIRKNIENSETVGQIAAKDMKKAELLKRLGIDFCCGGKKTIEEACLEKGLDVTRVKKELDETGKITDGVQLDFNSFTPSFLADYIVNVHHTYVNKNLPMISDLSAKVAQHHGPINPFLIEVAKAVNELNCELTTHMKKEEQVLFPAIKRLESGNGIGNSFSSVAEPIYVMERDHDIAGDIMKEIRRLTDDYSVPQNACNSVKMLYHKLKEFENDLFQHIHLENNILFPKVIAMEKN